MRPIHCCGIRDVGWAGSKHIETYMLVYLLSIQIFLYLSYLYITQIRKPIRITKIENALLRQLYIVDKLTESINHVLWVIVIVAEVLEGEMFLKIFVSVHEMRKAGPTPPRKTFNLLQINT
jgi:hypothetical protein